LPTDQSQSSRSASPAFPPASPASPASDPASSQPPNQLLNSLLLSLSTAISRSNDELSSLLTKATSSLLPRALADARRAEAQLELLQARARELQAEARSREPEGNPERDEALSKLSELHRVKEALGTAQEYLRCYATYSSLCARLHEAIGSAGPEPGMLKPLLGELGGALGTLRECPGHEEREGRYEAIVDSLAEALLPRVKSACDRGGGEGRGPLRAPAAPAGRAAAIREEYCGARVKGAMASWYKRGYDKDDPASFPRYAPFSFAASPTTLPPSPNPLSRSYLEAWFEATEAAIASDYEAAVTAVFPEEERPLVLGRTLVLLAEGLQDSFGKRVMEQQFEAVCRSHEVARGFVDRQRARGLAPEGDVKEMEGLLMGTFESWLAGIPAELAAAARKLLAAMADSCKRAVEEGAERGSPLVPHFRSTHAKLETISQLAQGITNAPLPDVFASFNNAVASSLASHSSAALAAADYSDVDESVDWANYRVAMEHVISCSYARPEAKRSEASKAKRSRAPRCLC
jgi:hypothetical protein